VLRLRADGHPVAFTGRDVDAGAELEAASGARFLPADATDESLVSEIVAAAARLGGGRLRGLVNNAGMSRRKPFAQTTSADWDEILSVNARSAFTYTREALEPLRGGGSVVMLASVAGHVGEDGLALYAASKAALIALAQSLALELGPEIRFNAVAPGQIATRMMHAVASDPLRRAAVEARIPAGRLGAAEDVAEAVAWLISDASSFVNGTTVVVDGGETAGIRSTRR
jgi:NAD(P)-dependent dehydrogenase (short-subunit alcohol dehydrogenase family)